jgi:hypothetical protein
MKKRILQECLRIAKEHNKPELHPEWGCYHHFSFVIVDNKILEWGTNCKGDPLISLGYPKWGKIHSEYAAWKRAKGLMNKKDYFSVVNIRLTKQGVISESKPCSCCFNFLKDQNCKHIWFTTDIGWCMIKLKGMV